MSERTCGGAHSVVRLCVLLLSGLSCTAQLALADSPILPAAAQVAGQWRAEGSSGTGCSFQLLEHDRAVLDPQQCLAPILGFTATSWIVQPDAILIGAEGAGVPMLFSRVNATRYRAHTRTGDALWIERPDQ